MGGKGFLLKGDVLHIPSWEWRSDDVRMIDGVRVRVTHGDYGNHQSYAFSVPNGYEAAVSCYHWLPRPAVWRANTLPVTVFRDGCVINANEEWLTGLRMPYHYYTTPETLLRVLVAMVALRIPRAA